MAVAVHGTWPGRIALRRGWSLAQARPWNRDVPDASLRLVRGSSGFLRLCADTIRSLGARSVASPPLHPGGTRMWARAGFQPYLELDLYQRALRPGPEPPSHAVAVGCEVDWPEAVAIDRLSFSALWRLDDLGLQEARAATPSSQFLVVRTGEGDMAGFAIVGCGSGTGYLQRVAVHPRWRGLGFGRSLVRAALQWAGGRGSSTMLLNTQTDNPPASGLYESEGFARLRERLQVLRS